MSTLNQREQPGLVFWALAFAIIAALCFIMLRVQLPPVSEDHHCFQKHRWGALRSYLNIKYCEPGECLDDLSGSFECTSGKLLEIVFDDDVWNVVAHGIDPMDGRRFVYTSFTTEDSNYVSRIRNRCLGE